MQRCRISKCNNKQHGKGYCYLHYIKLVFNKKEERCYYCYRKPLRNRKLAACAPCAERLKGSRRGKDFYGFKCSRRERDSIRRLYKYWKEYGPISAVKWYELTKRSRTFKSFKSADRYLCRLKLTMKRLNIPFIVQRMPYGIVFKLPLRTKINKYLMENYHSRYYVI